MKNSIEDLQLFESLLRMLARRAVGRTRANSLLLLAAIEAMETLDPSWRQTFIRRLDDRHFSLAAEVLDQVPASAPIPDGLVDAVLKDVMKQISGNLKGTDDA